MDFTDWFTEQMSQIGYGKSHTHNEIASQWMNFTDGHEDFHVMYLRAPMTPEAIRITFDSHNQPVLFVVDYRAVANLNSVSELPQWIRILHAVYYGRVYIYNDLDENIRAFHFDWNANIKQNSEPIDISGILFTDTDCKLRDFPGIFHIARFYDRAFWQEQEPQKPPKRKKPRSNANEDFWKEEWARQSHNNPNYSQKTSDYQEDINEAFARAFREHMRSHGVDYDEPYIKRPNVPTGDKWLQQFVATGSLDAAKTMYRQLSKQYHPDLNPGDTVAEDTFKTISVAFAKVRDILK